MEGVGRKVGREEGVVWFWLGLRFGCRVGECECEVRQDNQEKGESHCTDLRRFIAKGCRLVMCYQSTEDTNQRTNRRVEK
jgi:hypothetical protein